MTKIPLGLGIPPIALTASEHKRQYLSHAIPRQATNLNVVKAKNMPKCVHRAAQLSNLTQSDSATEVQLAVGALHKTDIEVVR